MLKDSENSQLLDCYGHKNGLRGKAIKLLFTQNWETPLHTEGLIMRERTVKLHCEIHNKRKKNKIMAPGEKPLNYYVHKTERPQCCPKWGVLHLYTI